MVKIKFNASMTLTADEDTNLRKKEKVSQAKPIQDETFLELNVDDIINNPMQPRIHIDNNRLHDLAASIKSHGIIQPIAVIDAGNGKYILKSGQRRLLAHKELGLRSIKAIIQQKTMLSTKESERALFEIAILENTQRETLDPLELALSLRKALNKGLYKNMFELSITLGRSKSYISKILKILSLNSKIIDDLEKNKSTGDIDSLYQIQKIENSEEQTRVYLDFIKKK